MISAAEIGARARQVREKNKLSLKAAAELHGIGLQTLIRYEKGTRYPPSDFLLSLLEKDPTIEAGWLLTGEKEMLSPEEITDEMKKKGEDLDKRMTRVVQGPLEADSSSMREWLLESNKLLQDLDSIFEEMFSGKNFFILKTALKIGIKTLDISIGALIAQSELLPDKKSKPKPRKKE